ncbi:MAG: hypothetical protein KDA45_04975 [Planctomycetales bacterium]|nr:hypothetical protein [Planctomycetales bacterium]
MPQPSQDAGADGCVPRFPATSPRHVAPPGLPATSSGPGTTVAPEATVVPVFLPHAAATASVLGRPGSDVCRLREPRVRVDNDE